MEEVKISKKFFKEIITTHKTALFAIYNEQAMNVEDLEKVMLDNLDLIKKYSARTAKEKGKYIVFEDGSHLDIVDNKYNKYETYLYRFSFGSVVASDCAWYSTYDDEWYHKTLYYMIID